MQTIKGMIEAGQVKPAIDRDYPLAAVPEAIRHVEQRRVQGKVVIHI
ncbi:MAG: zinc-binding dehydrogenase [Cyanobacteria bacterium J06627_15]